MHNFGAFGKIGSSFNQMLKINNDSFRKTGSIPPNAQNQDHP